MQFADHVLVRLATATARKALFDQSALERLVAAAYSRLTASLLGPYDPIFDAVQLGVSFRRSASLDGRFLPASQGAEARFTAAGAWDRESALAVDAVWAGAIVAHTVATTSEVSTAPRTYPEVGRIDEEIVAADGALPADPAALETERRRRFLAKVRAGLDQPAAFTEGLLDDWHRRVGAASIGELLTAARGELQIGTIRVSFTDPGATAPHPRLLPITVALLVRQAPFPLAPLLGESKLVRAQLEDAGVQTAGDASLARAAPVIVGWIVPASVFDDEDWPGAQAGTPAETQRAQRRDAAGRWLAAEGIGLVVVADHQ